jgi:hypothetical protein
MSNQSKPTFDSVKQLIVNGQQNELIIYGKLVVVKEGELWKQELFYNSDILYGLYAHLSFTMFLKKALNYSVYKFNTIGELTGTKNGKTILINYGYDNAKVWLGCSPAERINVLKHIKEYNCIDFKGVKQRLFPSNNVSKKDMNKDKVNTTAVDKELIDKDKIIEQQKKLIKEKDELINKLQTKLTALKFFLTSDDNKSDDDSGISSDIFGYEDCELA